MPELAGAQCASRSTSVTLIPRPASAMASADPAIPPPTITTPFFKRPPSAHQHGDAPQLKKGSAHDPYEPTSPFRQKGACLDLFNILNICSWINKIRPTLPKTMHLSRHGPTRQATSVISFPR